MYFQAILDYSEIYDFSDTHEVEVKLGLQDDQLLEVGDWEVRRN